MISMNKYTEIMNRVVLTDAMRDTALENIQKKRNTPKKRQWSWEKSLVLAASFVIVLTAAIVFPNINRGPDVEGPVTYGVTESATQQGGSVNKPQPNQSQPGSTGAASQSGNGSQKAAQTASGVQSNDGRIENSAGQPVLKSASPQNNANTVETANEESVQAMGPQEVNSRSALEQRMGRRLRMPTVLPFSANQFLFTDYGDGMGGVTETSGNNEIETRTAKLSDTSDPSGDYNVYKDTKVKTINGHSVTLKGNDGKYQVAVWNDGTYSYSVRSNKPLTEAEITAIVSSMK